MSTNDSQTKAVTAVVAASMALPIAAAEPAATARSAATLDAGHATGRASASDSHRVMPEAQRRTLSAVVLADKAFREQFLKDPAGAARRFGIVLTSADVQVVRDNASAIRSLGAKLDEQLWQESGGKLEIKLLPFISIGDSSGEEEPWP